jgi:hypothetical protein
MKATVKTWVRNECSETHKEFKNFEEFKSYDFTSNKSISLYAGDEKGDCLLINIFPDRTQRSPANYDYAVTLILDKEQKDIKLIPDGTDPDTINSRDNIYVTKELMLEAVRYYFDKEELNPNLYWHEFAPVILTDEEREEINREMEELFEKHGDPFNREPLR